MRTLSLLAALLVLALPGRAEPLKGADAQDPTALTAEQARDTEDQEPVMDGQDQPEDKEQDMAMSFYGEDRLAREAAAQGKDAACRCRRRTCRPGESLIGRCSIQGGVRYVRCCF